MAERRQQRVVTALAVASLALTATGTAVAVVDPFPPDPIGPPKAPTVAGPNRVQPAFGAPTTLTGTARPYTKVEVWADPGGPEPPSRMQTIRAEVDGTWTAEWVPDDDYLLFARADGFTSEQVVLATPTPVVDGPRTRYLPRGSQVTVTGRGTPGSEVYISFREPETPRDAYGNTRQLTVSGEGTWSLPLTVDDQAQFRLQRTPRTPPGPAYLIDAPHGPRVTDIQNGIRAAVQLTEWPQGLRPEIIPGKRPPFVTADIARCAAVGPLPSFCVTGPIQAPKRAVLVGDSLAVSYVETLRPIFAQLGWRFYPFATSGCTFTAPQTVSSSPTVQRLCPQKKEEAVEAIQRLEPDVVLVTNVYGGRKIVGAERAMNGQEWFDNTLEILERIEDDAGRIVLLAPPPIDADVTECYLPEGDPQACTGGVPDFWQDIADAERRLADRLDGVWLDTRPLFCLTDGRCPPVLGSTVIKTDEAHLSQPYAQFVVPALAELLQDAGVL